MTAQTRRRIHVDVAARVANLEQLALGRELNLVGGILNGDPRPPEVRVYVTHVLDASGRGKSEELPLHPAPVTFDGLGLEPALGEQDLFDLPRAIFGARN